MADSSGPGFGQEETSAAASAIESDASAGGGGGDSVEPSGEGSGGGVGGASHLVVDLNIVGMNIIFSIGLIVARYHSYSLPIANEVGVLMVCCRCWTVDFFRDNIF